MEGIIVELEFTHVWSNISVLRLLSIHWGSNSSQEVNEFEH